MKIGTITVTHPISSSRFCETSRPCSYWMYLQSFLDSHLWRNSKRKQVDPSETHPVLMILLKENSQCLLTKQHHCYHHHESSSHDYALFHLGRQSRNQPLGMSILFLSWGDQLIAYISFQQSH